MVKYAIIVVLYILHLYGKGEYTMFSLKHRFLVLAVCMGLGTAAMPAAPVQAISLGSLGTIVSAGAQYAYLNKQLNYLDNEGRDAYMDQIKEQYGVNTDARANAMTTQVIERLSASIAGTDESITKKPYNYFVNNDESFNAFCTIGHNISVNIGLFEPLNYNENEVAFVLAHEMGHGQKNHSIQGVKKSMPLSLLTSLYSAQGGAAQVGAAVISQLGSANLITKPMEKQADELAFTYAVNAGYNPGAGAALWQRMLDKSSTVKTSGVMALFSDHPTTESRRNTNSDYVTKWSNNVVKVNTDTGMITVNGKDWYTPAEAASMSSKERAYFVAGNLSAVYHQSKKPTGAVTVDSGNVLYVGPQAIVDLNAEQDTQQIVSRLKEIL